MVLVMPCVDLRGLKFSTRALEKKTSGLKALVQFNMREDKYFLHRDGQGCFIIGIGTGPNGKIGRETRDAELGGTGARRIIEFPINLIAPVLETRKALYSKARRDYSEVKRVLKVLLKAISFETRTSHT